MTRPLIFLSASACLLFSHSPALGDFTLFLKNGRQITVQSYREEGSMIKFRGLGGEIGIGKDQIQAIRKSGEEDRSGISFSDSATAPAGAPGAAEREPVTPPPRKVETPTPEEERAKEEREYQQKIIDINEQLKDVKERYSQAMRGTTGPNPTLLSDPEAIKVLNDDARARSLDAQNKPVDPGVVRLLTPSPFSSLPAGQTEIGAQPPVGAPFYAPVPAYSERQKDLSELRNRAIQLEQDRQKLIDEMRQKNFSTGSLFLE